MQYHPTSVKYASKEGADYVNAECAAAQAMGTDGCYLTTVELQFETLVGETSKLSYDNEKY